MPGTTPSRPLPALRLLLGGLALLAASSGTALALTPGICRAPADRPPCGASSAVTEPDLDSGISNPIDLGSGEKHLREIDLPAPAHGGHPSFIRHYQSSQTSNGILGPGWAHEYQVRIEALGAGWRITEATGRRYLFDAQGTARQEGSGHLQALPAPALHPAAAVPLAPQRWTRSDGRQMDFDTRGQLQALHAPGHATITLSRHAQGPLAGEIHHILKAGGRLTLHYDTIGKALRLTALDTPLGTFRYRYTPEPGTRRAPPTHLGSQEPDAALLREMQRPDGMRRLYHREPDRQGGYPQAITGITLANPQDDARWRARTWVWDKAGRVVRAHPGSPSPTTAGVDLGYDLPGRAPDIRITRIKGAAAQAEFEYRRQGARTLPLGVRLTPCAGCPTQEYPVERDRWGRLTRIDELQIQRHPNGAVYRLQKTSGGWPELMLEHDASGRRTAWSSRLTGRTEASYDTADRLQGLHYANGDTLDITRDAAGRPVQLHYRAPGQEPVTVRLQWHGTHLRQLSHPAEDETRTHDTQGRLTARAVRRPHPSGSLRYQEKFFYDASGRLRRHDLPEGGALHYGWGDGGRLTALTWESADGARHPVLRTLAGQPGYRYGNGLHLQTALSAQDTRLLLSDGPRPLWGEQRSTDARGRIEAASQMDLTGASDTVSGWRYVHDAEDRLIGLKQAAPTRRTANTTWLAWNDDGSLAARIARTTDRQAPAMPAATPPPSEAGPTNAPGRPDTIPRDASGLPLSAEGRTLRYQAQRLLAEIRTPQGLTTRTTHNAQGHAIRRQTDAAETERYYLDNRLVALWHRPAAGPASPPNAARQPAFGVTQRYLYAHDVPVGLLQTDAQGQTRLYYIHADLTGRPVRVTDEHRQVRWSATYDAFGRAYTQGDLNLPLRAPGQDEDPATGWHDNVFRTYLPDAGHYLEPDPLGPAPGQQALGYAAQQPLRHVDPLGLILLAFDGTRYDRQSQGNVWKLTQAYDGGTTFYHAGPGNSLSMNWDALTAASSSQILRTQWQSLMGGLRQAQGAAQPVPIDLLGFSRGAALARDFANRIARQTRNGWFSYDDPLLGTVGLCVDLRFLGLFDTVAQFGLLGASNAGYDLTLSGAWQWVAHAVALHEFRTLFPLVSATLGTAGHAVEAGFIGAHADIGGGLARDDEGHPIPDGDLSDVALNWMRWQALAALVPLRPLPAEDQRVTQALLHDDRIPAERWLENGDRPLQDANTTVLGPQGNDAQLGAAQRQALEAYIRRFGAWQVASGHTVGTVDMAGYDQWLQEALGLPSLVHP